MKNKIISSAFIFFFATASFAEETCEALFVQNSEGMTYDGNQLTMKKADPNIIYFCDRPVREAGHLTSETFLQWGTEGEDSFVKDPPNAAVSVLAGQKDVSVVVVLNGRPVISGDNMIYPVKVLEGELPKEGGETIIFIDPLGRPLSPTSVAGVHRRHVRRARR